MGLNTICLNNIHSDDDDFDDDNPEIIINDRLKAWCNRYKQCKTYKKRYKQRINGSCLASNKMAGLLYDKRFKQNRTILYSWKVV